MRKAIRTQRSSRSRRARRWVDNALLLVVIGVFGIGAAAVISGNYQVRPVLSGSMEPLLSVGGVVVTERVPTSAVRVRDVVAFHRPGQAKELTVHRIIALTPGRNGPVVQTKGDANRLADPWKASMDGPTAYRAVYAVPLVGYVAVWVHSPSGRLILVLVGLLMILIAAAGTVFHLRRTARRATLPTEKLDKPDKSGNPDKLDKPGNPDKLGKPDKPGKSGKPGKLDKFLPDLSALSLADVEAALQAKTGQT